MSKRTSQIRNAKKQVEGQQPPRLFWVEGEDGHTPVIQIANIIMPLDPRPVPEFAKGERDAILVYIKQMLSEILFDVPVYLVHPKTGVSARNPDWDLQEYYEMDPLDPKSVIKVTPTPSVEQTEAGERLIMP